jgi:acyl-CoA reductase-like NAD-dependent aldehyde dehydrogenase
MVAFTGSSETGKAIMALASHTVKRLQLELGGKNPVIVLDDADVDAAAAAMVGEQCFNSGQTCGSPGRFYVHEKVYDEFLEKYTAATKKLVVGDPNNEKTDLGPLVSAEHRDRVEGYIKSGIVEGARVILGGKRPTTPPMNKGYFVVPTIFTNVTQKMKIAREEIFGPVSCFMEKFNSDNKVIEMANDNVFGLNSWVWTKDTARAMRFANEIQAGTVQIGQRRSGGPELPWGGYKESGIGKEGSLYGLYEYTNLKRIHVDLMTPPKRI